MSSASFSSSATQTSAVRAVDPSIAMNPSTVVAEELGAASAAVSFAEAFRFRLERSFVGFGGPAGQTPRPQA